MKQYFRNHALIVTALVLCALAVATGVQAQNDDPGTQTRDRAQNQIEDQSRDQVRDGVLQQEQNRDRDRSRAEMHNRIDTAPGLTSQERTEMHGNLDACFDLGVPDVGLKAVFPGEDSQRRVSTQAMLRLQNRVVTVAREGLDTEAMLAKIQEGRTKGVPEPLLEKACERVETHVRAASQIMEQAKEDGFDPPGDQIRERRVQREMAHQMWRGMNEEGYDRIRERARLRLQDGRCGVDELADAGELATRLMEAGVDSERALRLSGEALQKGYRSREIRQLQGMVALRHQRDGAMDEFLGGMEHCIDTGMGPGEMYNYMMRHGWMGPGDMYGPGGYQPMDHKGYGGDSDDGGHGGHGGGGSHTGGGNGG